MHGTGSANNVSRKMYDYDYSNLRASIGLSKEAL